MLERQRLLQAQRREMSSRGAPGGPLRQHGKDPRMSSGTPPSELSTGCGQHAEPRGAGRLAASARQGPRRE